MEISREKSKRGWGRKERKNARDREEWQAQCQVIIACIFISQLQSLDS